MEDIRVERIEDTPLVHPPSLQSEQACYVVPGVPAALKLYASSLSPCKLKHPLCNLGKQHGPPNRYTSNRHTLTSTRARGLFDTLSSAQSRNTPAAHTRL